MANISKVISISISAPTQVWSFEKHNTLDVYKSNNTVHQFFFFPNCLLTSVLKGERHATFNNLEASKRPLHIASRRQSMQIATAAKLAKSTTAGQPSSAGAQQDTAAASSPQTSLETSMATWRRRPRRRRNARSPIPPREVTVRALFVVTPVYSPSLPDHPHPVPPKQTWQISFYGMWLLGLARTVHQQW